MEAAAAWGPQLASWIPQEPAAGGIPVEYAVSIDIPAASTYQLPESNGQQLAVEYYNNYYSADSVQHYSNAAATGEQFMISNDSRATSVVTQVMGEFEEHIGMMKHKMHRYPVCLGSVDEAYTLPSIVAIGPYHHGLEHLKAAETVKHAAACHCVMQSGCLLEDLYGAVVPVADSVRCLYDKDVMAGIGYEEFRHMMFFDACFLVQNMLMRSGHDKIDKSLWSFLRPNKSDVNRDVMLLENQIPWIVVEKVMSFMPMASTIAKNFVYAKRNCMLPDDDSNLDEQKPFEWNDSYKPPHILGLLRYYIVGRSDTEYPETTHRDRYAPSSVSVVKLSEIGIKVTANKTTELIDMRLNQNNVFAELALPPLSLDRARASYLINMAAFELCTVDSFSKAKASESAFWSYLMLLAMLVYREEDVHELRVRGLLVGGGGLTNKEVLRFLTSLQGMRLGQFYNYVMVQIESYRENLSTLTKWYLCLSKHRKSIGWAFTGMVSVGSIIVTIVTSRK